MKYKLTEKFIEFYERKLYLIQALKDFGDVKAGDLGGWIEKEENLSQEGDCWVYDEGKVCNNAVVRDNARVRGNGIVRENAEVWDNARVYGWTIISGNAVVKDNARVGGSAEVSGNAVINGDTKIFEGIHE